MKINSLPKLEGMDEDCFWTLVELAHWPCDYEKARIMYRRQLSKEGCENFHKAVGKAYGLLDRTIIDNDNAESIFYKSFESDLNVGDDGYGDLLYHIIGLGRKEYFKYLNNYNLIKKLANSHGFKESFHYCIPYDDDYGKNTDTLQGLKPRRFLVKQLRSCEVGFPIEGYQCSP